MEVNKIYCEDCISTINRMIDDNFKVDMVITSPPYNTSAKNNTKPRDENTDISKLDHHFRYDGYNDCMSNDEYIDFIINVMCGIEKCLVKDGVIAFNISYGALNPSLLYEVIYNIINRTPLMVAEQIAWKKSSCMPVTTRNRLSRVVEPVFILVRKDEFDTFNCYKDKGRKNAYVSVFNYVSTPPNDESTNLNKATFSSKLVMFLANLYCKDGGVIYDPFMGTGTTGVGAKKTRYELYRK